jgi:hypothetical protein
MRKEKVAFLSLFWIPAIGLWWFYGFWMAIGFWAYSCCALKWWDSRLTLEEKAYWREVGVLK